MRCICNLIFFALLASSCHSRWNDVPVASESMARDFEVSLTDLQKGREIFMQHCQACHERVPPGKIDPEYWRSILPHMSQRAHLSPKDTQSLQNYLIAAHGTVHRLNQSSPSNP